MKKIILAALIIISTALVGCAPGGLVGMIEHAGDGGGVGGSSVPEDALHHGYGLVTLDDPVTGKMQNNGNTGIGAIDGQDKVRLLRRASVYLAPGKHSVEVVFRVGSPVTYNFTTEAGKIYFLPVAVNPGRVLVFNDSAARIGFIDAGRR
jgi:hypothetical protein